MRGLLLKDYYGTMRTMKQTIGITLFISLFSFLLKSASYAMMMGMIMSINLMLNILTIDEKGGWAYLMATPVRRKVMIKEKYVFSFILISVLILLCAVISAAVTAVYGLDWGEFLLYLITAFVYFFLTGAIVLPINIKVGVEIGRFISSGIFIIPGVLLFVAAMVMKGRGGGTELDTTVGCLVSLAALMLSLILWVASYFISVNIFQKKEIQ